mmetsp:Transcript_130988/g.407368  ORF Transcript_130988/g.407368 Transcript_130988/m.407368 type:complete len:229 (-) Transcript_130988:480-1166(-)
MYLHGPVVQGVLAVSRVARHRALDVRLIAVRLRGPDNAHELLLLDVAPLDAAHLERGHVAQHPGLHGKALALGLVGVAHLVVAEQHQLVLRHGQHHLPAVLGVEEELAALVIHHVDHADLPRLHEENVVLDEALLNVIIRQRRGLEAVRFSLAGVPQARDCLGVRRWVETQVVRRQGAEQQAKIRQLVVAALQGVLGLRVGRVLLELLSLGEVLAAQVVRLGLLPVLL